MGRLMGVWSGDLEGFFLITMLAMLDTFLEDPVDNPLATSPSWSASRPMPRPGSPPREPSITRP
jgi:hypothetical protein